MRGTFIAAAAFAILAGCNPSSNVLNPDAPLGKVEPPSVRSGPDVVLLRWETPAQRDAWVQARIDCMTQVGWETILPDLVQVGAPAVPVLIKNLDRREQAFRMMGGEFSVHKYDNDEGFEMGEVVHHVLRQIIVNYSDYQGDGLKLPGRDSRDDGKLKDSKAAWQKWWDQNGAALTVGHLAPIRN
jgi:hypothetical protein